MEGEECCNISLSLSIGGEEFKSSKSRECKGKLPSQLHALFPLQEEEGEGEAIRKDRSILKSDNIEELAEDFEARFAGNNEVGGRRKKLKLGREQVALLEGSFAEHNSLNSKQKQELASKLNIQARQVEIWFQNRRARTKLKKTEVDFESLKKCCEKLSEENQRLREEIEELRRRRPDFPSYMHLQKSSMCPSCGRRRADASGSSGRSNDAFSVKKERENWSLCIMG
ncbi:homeobox-leucine zipper protein HAT22-like [Canna indica]|uniref:Homeobox-leucine zipper protein HAT22-like n=1 Tax=Canna indica TaxID=4628 RepID=A0AAQ3L2E9_9LILI|nr:homeobox-leucine zipper protein HAT22-like [Canna indica]